MEAYYLHTILKWKRGFALYNLFILYKSLEETHRNGNPDRIHLVCASILFWLVILISIAYSPIIGYIGKLSNGNLIQSFSSHWLFICRVQLAFRVNTHNFSFIFIQNINIAYYFKTKEAGVLFYIICLYCSVVICLHEAVAQLTDELSWWRHRVRCCSNCRCVLPSPEVFTWSPDLPSTNFQVRE